MYLTDNEAKGTHTEDTSPSGGNQRGTSRA